MNIGENIKRYRKQKKLTQPELAEMINKSESSIRKYENGSVIPDIDVINKIAEALGVSFKQLTTIRVEKRINDLMKEKNISIDDMAKKSGLLKKQLPINENGLEIIYPREELNKISEVFNISLEELLRDTTIENWYVFNDEENNAINYMASRMNSLSERNNINIPERRKLNNISTKTMALLLDVNESEIENFEKEPYKHPIMKSKYIHTLIQIEDFRENVFNTIFNSDNIDLKFIINLPTDQYVKFINYISTNISLVTDIIKLSRIDMDNSRK